MEDVIKQFLAVSSGDGSGYGYAVSSGDGSGSGYGDGSGSGSGYGSGDGSGSGSGDGSGYGSGDGYYSGDGYGYGYGDGSGYGYDYGYSYGYGYDYGYGDGSGDGIKSYDGHEVYIIDDMQTIIYSVHGNIARGATINIDLTLADCYIAKCEDYFAHGETAKQAMADAQSKAYQNKPIEERIGYVIENYPDVDVPIEHSALFSLHNFLTGSCLFGRREFANAHSLDPEHGAMTMREFIHLTKDAFGGDNIRQLADAYKIKL